MPATADADSQAASRRMGIGNLSNFFLNPTNTKSGTGKKGRKAEVSEVSSVRKYSDLPKTQKIDFLGVLLCLVLILQSHTWAFLANFCETAEAFPTQQ